MLGLIEHGRAPEAGETVHARVMDYAVASAGCRSARMLEDKGPGTPRARLGGASRQPAGAP